MRRLEPLTPRPLDDWTVTSHLHIPGALAVPCRMLQLLEPCRGAANEHAHALFIVKAEQLPVRVRVSRAAEVRRRNDFAVIGTILGAGRVEEVHDEIVALQ